MGLVGFDSEWCGHCDYYLAVAVSPDRVVFHDRLSAAAFLGSPAFDDGSIVTAHYGRADWRALGQYPAMKVHDSLTLGWLFDEEPPHGLKERGPRFLKMPFDEPITVRASTGETLFNGVHIAEADQNAVTEYCAQDAAGTLGLTTYYLSRLSPSLLKWYEDVEVPMDYVLYLCERQGIGVDMAKMEGETLALSIDVRRALQKVYEVVGYEFNANSTQQLAKVLYSTTWSQPHIERKHVGDYKNGKPKMLNVEVLVERPGLGLRAIRKTDGGLAATDKETLLIHQGNPAVDAIVEYKTLETALSYLQSYPAFIKNGRLCGTYKQANTVTGRLSSSDPNMQNIPRRGPLGKRIRSLFVAEPGNVLIVADLDQIEYRILAELSGEAKLVEAFVKGQDVHSRTAELMGVKSRDVGKTGNYAAVYDCGPRKFAQLCTAAGMPTSETQAKALLATYYAQLPAVLSWKNAVRRQAIDFGFVFTLGLRKRHLPAAMFQHDEYMRSRALRQAVNSVIQGSAADLVKVWMVKMQQYGIPMLAQIHDEVLVEVPADQADLTARLMVSTLDEAAKSLFLESVPVTSTPKIVHSWGDK